MLSNLLKFLEEKNNKICNLKWSFKRSVYQGKVVIQCTLYEMQALIH